LLSQGQLEIVSENDGSMQWRTMFRNWPLVVEAELEDGQYYFTKREANLITRTDGKFGFADGYLVPSEALHVRRCWLKSINNTEINVDWVQDGSYVYLDNSDGCWIEYLDVGGIDLWSANFSRGVQKRMEAIISRAVREEYGEADSLDKEAEVYFQRARTNSSKARSARKLYNKGTIASARNRRG
jgi:hypothetical protein